MPLKNQKLILTFDYELFLGANSGFVRDCLISPVDELLKVMQEYDAHGVFFIDSSYLLKLNESDNSDFSLVIEQIGKIVKNGHDVGLHLHPHWQDAELRPDGTWNLSKIDKYRFAALPVDYAEEHFDKCYSLLQDIVNQFAPFYKIKAFRAGGWSIAPFNNFSKLFVKHGILMDFSVIPGGVRKERPLHYYDNRKAPLNMWKWNFEKDPCIVNTKGRFTEIPVTTYKINPLLFILNKYYHTKNSERFAFGTGVARTNWKNQLRKVLLGKKIAALDDISVKCANMILKHLNSKEVICFVGHPKMFSKQTFDFLKLILSQCSTLSVHDIEN